MASDAPSSQSYSTDPALYLYTSLTAGSSHIVTATSRLETILRANKVPFKALDIATDEKARMLWGRRAGKDESGRVRKLPGLVQMGVVLGDIVEIEDWNEFGELKQNVTMYYDEHTQPPISEAPPAPALAPKPDVLPAPPPSSASSGAPPTPVSHPMAAAAAEAAAERASRKSAESSRSSAAASLAPSTATRSIAEEAAAKAKQVRLQSLRNKVYGKAGGKEGDAASSKSSDKEESEEQQPRASTSTTATQSELGGGAETIDSRASGSSSYVDSAALPAPLFSSKGAAAGTGAGTGAGAGTDLQSPTSGAWKDTADSVPRTLQSPTSTSWKPAEEGQNEEATPAAAAPAVEGGGGGDDGKRS